LIEFERTNEVDVFYAVTWAVRGATTELAPDAAGTTALDADRAAVGAACAAGARDRAASPEKTGTATKRTKRGMTSP